MSNVVIIVLFAQMPTVILLIPFGSQLVHCKKPEEKKSAGTTAKGPTSATYRFGWELKSFLTVRAIVSGAVMVKILW